MQREDHEQTCSIATDRMLNDLKMDIDLKI